MTSKCSVKTSTPATRKRACEYQAQPELRFFAGEEGVLAYSYRCEPAARKANLCA
jgi:hypothetical protein